MKLYITVRAETLQLLHSVLPRFSEVYSRDYFEEEEVRTLNPDFLITEYLFISDRIPEVSLLPPEKLIILGFTDDNLQRILPFVRKSAQYFPPHYQFSEVNSFLLQNYHEQKIKLYEQPREYTTMNIIGDSSEILRIRKEITQFGPHDEAVSLFGESGTGKDLIARAIHKSSRKKGPFVPVNCASVPDQLLESMMFGTKKGAFTGSEDNPGYFETAHNGTLFLDEIGEMSPTMQAKLLRVTEDKMVRRLGSMESKSLNIRIISATSRNLKEMISRGEFREDLYYRLNTLQISVPPLRLRKNDIPELAGYFLLKNRYEKRISKGAMNRLIDHTWPGNIRELRNVIMRAVILSDDRKMIMPEHICFY